MFENMHDDLRPVEPKTVFVTGATGLLGNNLVRALLARGYRVRALVRSEAKAARFLKGLDVELVVSDVTLVSSYAERLSGCDAVFHTAAYFREYYRPGDHSAELERVNVHGALSLMAAADERGVRMFVHTSSSGTIGAKPDGSPGDEDTAPSPEQLANGYFRSKVLGDERIREWRPPHGMSVVEILPGWMWGPHDAAPTGAGRLALDFLARKVPVVPDGGTCTVDARDVAEAMVLAAERAAKGARFIVAGRYRELSDVLGVLERASGVPAPRMKLPNFAVMAYAFLEERRAAVFGGDLLVTREAIRLRRARHMVSSARAERALGVTFRPFDETIRDVVAWYRGNGFVTEPTATPCGIRTATCRSSDGTHA